MPGSVFLTGALTVTRVGHHGDARTRADFLPRGAIPAQNTANVARVNCK